MIYSVIFKNPAQAFLYIQDKQDKLRPDIKIENYLPYLGWKQYLELSGAEYLQVSHLYRRDP